jgi:hypothetical protein
MGLIAGGVAGFWQVPVVGFGATTGVVGVVEPVPVPPPVTTAAAERLTAAKTKVAKARSDFIVFALLYG